MWHLSVHSDAVETRNSLNKISSLALGDLFYVKADLVLL